MHIRRRYVDGLISHLGVVIDYVARDPLRLVLAILTAVFVVLFLQNALTDQAEKHPTPLLMGRPYGPVAQVHPAGALPSIETPDTTPTTEQILPAPRPKSSRATLAFFPPLSGQEENTEAETLALERFRTAR